ncbi:MAG: sel1 repeat family protein [Desulfofustis sp.]|nr:sel1 repeat family protein [Desulfofustis sp.]
MHSQIVRRIAMFFCPFLLLGLVSNGRATAEGTDFTLTVVNTHQTMSCGELRLESGCFLCKRGDITYRYKADAIEKVTYKGEAIYPYDIPVELTEADLYEKDCDYLVKTLKSPLILENNPDIFILVGTMYEKGICTRRNIQQAYTYYRKAGKPGKKKYADLRRKSG